MTTALDPVLRARTAAAAADPPGASGRSLRFEGLEIRFGPGVIEPRPWTALQSRWATELLTSGAVGPGPVLELCAGAGHIGLAAVRPTSRSLVQVDAEPRACAWAEHNATAAALAHRTSIRCGDVNDVLAAHEEFPLVIADPPYVPSHLVDEHPDDPLAAIDGGPDGLDVVRLVVAVAARHLADDGHLLLQAGGAAQLAEVARACTGGLGARPDRRLALESVRSRDADRAVGHLRWAADPTPA